MRLQEKLWDLLSYDQAQAAGLATALGTSSLVTGLLLERGLASKEEMAAFLYGSPQPFHDPFLMRDMDKAAERLSAALDRGEKVTIYGDYDVDGITASSLLYLYLRRRGGRVSTYIPSRQSEGYGLNDEALQSIAEQGCTLLLTVDCGISGWREVAGAPKGLDIIITDHHTVPPELPAALAVINPKQPGCPYPFKDLSGVGLAFKLCQALEKQRGADYRSFADFVELAALGTVADIVPLTGENRELVRRGLQAMKGSSLLGLQALIRVSGYAQRELDTESISFALAPRLNAVGRLERAQRAVELLICQDREEAEGLAAELNQENALRQQLSNAIQSEAEALLARQSRVDTAIILASEQWHSGIIGIVASRLVDKYHLPTLLFSIKDGMAKGSCRSIPALDLYQAIAAEKDLLTQFGGHHQAAGLTLPAAKLEAFAQRFRAYVAQHLQAEDYLPHQRVDCLLGPEDRVTLQDLEQLSLLEPCGCGNPSPVFAFRQARLHNPRAIGREGHHLQIQIANGAYGYSGIMWQRGELLVMLHDGMEADVAFQPRKNLWQGEERVQLQLLSLKVPLAVYDLRRRPGPKEELLRQLCQTRQGVTVLVREASALPPSPQYQVQTYERLEPRAWQRTLVLYQLPPQGLEPVRQGLGEGQRELVLLYQKEDYRQALAALAWAYPERSQLVAAYKALQEALGAGRRSPQELATLCSPAALAIFKDLGLVREEAGALALVPGVKQELARSGLYQGGLEQRQRQTQLLCQAWQGRVQELIKGL